MYFCRLRLEILGKMIFLIFFSNSWYFQPTILDKHYVPTLESLRPDRVRISTAYIFIILLYDELLTFELSLERIELVVFAAVHHERCYVRTCSVRSCVCWQKPLIEEDGS